MDMAFVKYMALVACFVIGLVPVMLSHLSMSPTPQKWRYTAIWAFIWWLPPMSKLYMLALS